LSFTVNFEIIPDTDYMSSTTSFNKPDYADMTDVQATNSAALTRLLLSGGIIAGPLYLAVGFIQAFTREGFDITRHSLSLLSNGELGWIHMANLIISGSLVIGAAVGMRWAMREKQGISWGPILLSIYGLGLVLSGIFRADPAMGFPPGTPENASAISSSGMLHFLTGGIGFLGLIAACFVFAHRFAKLREEAWTTSSVATGVIFLAGFIGIASGSGNGWTIFGFWLAVIAAWIWVSSLSGKLRKEVQ
jgi:hypothetical protein